MTAPRIPRIPARGRPPRIPLQGHDFRLYEFTPLRAGALALLIVAVIAVVAVLA